MKIGIVIPTIQGREAMLDVVLAAYEATRPSGWEYDVVIPEGYETVGEAWTAGAADADGDYLHFGVDDAEPIGRWAEAGVAWTTRASLPSPRVVKKDGALEQCGSMGGGMVLPECETGTVCRTSPLPMVTREVWELVGGFMPGHYYCDDDYCWRALRAGVETVVVREYAFRHHGLIHRPAVARAHDDQMLFRERAAKMSVKVPA